MVAALLALLWVTLWVTPGYAHIGSPGIYAEGDAGPYKLFVTVRPPASIPGVAEIEIRTSAAQIDEIHAVPIPLTGEASEHPPTADLLKRSTEDPQFYTGNLWIMANGSWQIRFSVSGGLGRGELSIPIAAAATATLKMQPALITGLSLIGVFLMLGMIGIVGASARDAQLPPGAPVTPARRRRGRLAMAVALAALLLTAWLGGRWWRADAASYAKNVYKPLAMDASLDPGNVLDLKLLKPGRGSSGWMRSRRNDDFILDHGHPMHLYAIREPQMDVVFHLHPVPVGPGDFRLVLPSMPAGSYQLYADVVHADGFPETLAATIALPAITGRALAGDDAYGAAPPLTRADDAKNDFHLADGYRMLWARPAVLKANQPKIFEFYLLDRQGRPPADMALYMGMLGHAAFVKTDGTVFAHVHPSGTPAMAAMMIAQQQNDGPAKATMNMSMPMGPGADAMSGPLPNHVGFPYGFPTPGKYRIFVQMKHGNTVETGSFDALIAP